jgi:glycosyltransferase involved in cell wall biosynthesis
VKVLHVTDVVEPLGGAQIYVHGIVGMLAVREHEVAVLHGDRTELTPAGAAAAEYGSAGVADWIAAFGPDVVHVHSPRLLPSLQSTLHAFPVVYSLHDFSFACASGTKYFRNGAVCTRPHGPGCLITGLARGCAHRVDLRPVFDGYRRISRDLPLVRAAATVVAHSEFMRSVALANRLRPERVEVIPYFAVRAAEPAAPSPDRTVAFVGRIVPDKGLDTLIEALASCPDFWDRLLIAGDGWDRDRCSQIAHRRGIGERVEFLGHLDMAGVVNTLRRARVMAVPSRWPEPFGIVGLEAMAQGRPVVASRVGGIPEWLDDGRTGALVDAGDVAALAAVLASILSDVDRAHAMGLEGWRQVEGFSPENHVNRLLSVYEAAAGRQREAAVSQSAS